MTDGGINPSSEDHAAEPLRPGVGLSRSRRSRARSREGSPYSHKFLLATGVLAGIAVAAVIVAIVVLLQPDNQVQSARWSSWSPPDSGLAGERDIADEVAPLYRASPAEQLAVVTVRNLSNTSTSSQLALRDPNNGSLAAISGSSAIYTLCGLGPNCSVATGTPSEARLLLLRREALELALYTFKYISGVQNVVAVLPPGRTQPTATLTRKPPPAGKTSNSVPIDLAVVFQRDSLKRFLSQPLRDTLPEVLPPSVTGMSNAPEAELVSVITGQALFTQHLIQSSDGSSVLVLNPVPPR